MIDIDYSNSEINISKFNLNARIGYDDYLQITTHSYTIHLGDSIHWINLRHLSYTDHTNYEEKCLEFDYFVDKLEILNKNLIFHRNIKI